MNVTTMNVISWPRAPHQGYLQRARPWSAGVIALLSLGFVAFPGVLSASAQRQATLHDRLLTIDDGHHLELVDLDVNEVRKVSPSLRFESAALSRNGTEIAATRIGRAGLWLINADSGLTKRLTSGDDSNPTWSPDGTWLAFARGEGQPPLNGQGLYAIRSSGRGLHLIVGGVVSTPAWSPDGKTLAFDLWTVRSWDATNQQWLHTTTSLEVVSMSGRGLRHLTSHTWSFARQGADDSDPMWSPNGASLAFQRTAGAGDSEGSSVYVISSRGAGLRRLTPATFFAELTGWSPDGSALAGWESKICKACSSNGPIEAWVAGMNSGPRSGFSAFTSVEWSPSGKLVAFGCRAATAGVCLIASGSTVLQPIANAK